MSDDYKMPDAYEGGSCQVEFKNLVQPIHTTLSIGNLKPNHNITFHNAEGYEVGALDFNGPSLSFEGVAEESAIVFMNWIAESFAGRLKEERNKARQECLDLYSQDDLAHDWHDKIKRSMEP